MEAAAIIKNLLGLPNEDQNDVYIKSALFWKKESIHYAFLSMGLLIDFRKKAQQCDVMLENELRKEQTRQKKRDDWINKY